MDDVVEAVTMEDISVEVMLNWDKTGNKLVLRWSWTMEKQEEDRVELVGVNNKRQITHSFVAVFVVIFYWYS